MEEDPAASKLILQNESTESSLWERTTRRKDNLVRGEEKEEKIFGSLIISKNNASDHHYFIFVVTLLTSLQYLCHFSPAQNLMYFFDPFVDVH